MRCKSMLHGYQVDAVDHILTHPRSALFLEMGLGKTVSTLTAIHTLMFEYLEVSKVLVVGTKRVAENVWTAEAQEWEHTKALTFSVIAGTEKQRIAALKRKADIYTIGRDNVAWLCSLFGGGFLDFDMVVVDELTSFKNHSSLRFQALQKASAGVPRFVGLTGTPAPKSLIDLWSQMFLIDRGERLGHKITHFRKAYFTQDPYCAYKYDILPGMAEVIHNKLKDICISMKAEDYLSMPDKVVTEIPVVMPPALAKMYTDFERKKVLELAALEQITAANAAALCNKLQQFANGYIYDVDKNVSQVHTLKLDVLEEIVEANPGEPVIVAYAFQHERDAILRRFKKARVLDKKKDEDDWNAGKIEMLVMHPASGGHGLNLQKGGNRVIWYGNTWSLESEQQLNARLYRQGQTKPVFISKLITTDTVDERIVASQQSKEVTQSALMEATRFLIKKYTNKKAG